MKSLSTLSPGITTMIRMDHTHVLATFHKYRVDSSPDKKQALANVICTALEIHAQLEEEIFYPAMRAIDPRLVDKSVPEHDEMRRLISVLRSLRPGDPSYDSTLMELMRDVMHHVADEETILLPDAERVLAGKLDDLGAQMTRRRLQLAKPRAGEIAINTARAYPGLVVGTLALLALGAAVTWHAVSASSPSLTTRWKRRAARLARMPKLPKLASLTR